MSTALSWSTWCDVVVNRRVTPSSLVIKQLPDGNNWWTMLPPAGNKPSISLWFCDGTTASKTFAWIFLCFFRDVVDEQALLQTSHTYGFSPVCVRWCWINWPLVVNRLSQSEHLYGFSPECIRMWADRSCLANLKAQKSIDANQTVNQFTYVLKQTEHE